MSPPGYVGAENVAENVEWEKGFATQRRKFRPGEISLGQIPNRDGYGKITDTNYLSKSVCRV
jgi:hypothetical protein